MKLKLLLVGTFFCVIYHTNAQQDTSDKDAENLIFSYYNDNFNPFKKGNWLVTLQMSLQNENYTNVKQLLQTVVDGKSNDMAILVGTGYYFSDFFAATLGFSYEESRFEGIINQGLQEINQNSLTTLYGIEPNIRASIPVVPNQRLNLFVDVGFDFGWGNTVSRDKRDGETLAKSYAENYEFGVGISPGITFFVMENFSLEIGVDVIGYNYSKSTITDDDRDPQIDEIHSIDFKLSIISLGLGLTYYIGTKK